MVELAERPTSILSAKRKIKSFRKAEEDAVKFEYEIGGEVWRWYGGMVHNYDATFSRILSTFRLSSFRQFLAERANRGLSTNVLDLMGGDASFLRDLKYPANKQDNPSPLNVGLCVTLVDGRQERLQALDRKLNIEVLCGDLTSKSAWDLIDKKQRAMGIGVFDLIVCRGADGVAENMIPRALYPFLFGKIWGRLSDQDGLFSTQLPETVIAEEILGQLSSIPGIKLNFQPKGEKYDESYPSLGIIKTNTAQASLI